MVPAAAGRRDAVGRRQGSECGERIFLIRPHASAAQLQGAMAGGHRLGGDVSLETRLCDCGALSNRFRRSTLLVNNAGFVHQARSRLRRGLGSDVRRASARHFLVPPPRPSRHARRARRRDRQHRLATRADRRHRALPLQRRQGRHHRPHQIARARGEPARCARQCGGAGADQHRARRSASPEAWREAKAAELPLGRFGEPEDVAATVAFLASPAARSMSARRWDRIPAM